MTADIMAASEHAEYDYIPDNDLSTAAQVAMVLGRPLLLTGEPGTGKTTFASYVAQHLGPEHFRGDRSEPQQAFALHTFETKSTSVATDLFYRFDSLRRFHAAYDSTMSRKSIDYLTFEALGKAILETHPGPEIAGLVADPYKHNGPRRAVVLIDEIDKAPRDFPNDLLNEIDRMFFRIPELATEPGEGTVTVTANEAMRPIVVLTSNSEKNLPGPFLRRCVFHHIRFPVRQESSRLLQIVRARIGGTDALATSAIDFFYDVREQLELDKLPTTQELIQWIQILRRLARPVGHVSSTIAVTGFPFDQVKATLGVLGKTAHDLDVIEQLLASKSTSQRLGK